MKRKSIYGVYEVDDYAWVIDVDHLAEWDAPENRGLNYDD